MAVLEIRRYGDPILREKAHSVDNFGPLEKEILDNMVETLEVHEGIGLAAPQVGVDRRLIVVKGEDKVWKLVNPEIIKKKGEGIAEEGCLSLPGIYINVKRASEVVVRAIDTNGEVIVLEGDGLLARALQHEIDHLDGVLIIDYASPAKRILVRKKLQLTVEGKKNNL